MWTAIRRCCAVGLVALSAVTSCGGSEESGSTGDRPGDPPVGTEPALGDPELEATIEEAASLALERFGDLETAGVAILVAYYSGYSFDQIVAGVQSGALTAEGTIEGVDLELGFASFRGRARAADLTPDDIEQARAALAEQDRLRSFYTQRLLEAVSLGVSPARIVEAIVLGRSEFFGLVERADCHKRYRRHTDAWGDCLDEADSAYGPGVFEPFEHDPADDDAEPIPDTTQPGIEESPPAEPPASPADPDADYVFSAVLELSGDGATVSFEWTSEFGVDENGDIAGDGTMHGVSAATCRDPTGVSATYSFEVAGTYQLVGQRAGDELQINFANSTGGLTAEEGDRSILCVDVAADIAAGFAMVDLGAVDLGGPLVVPEAGGSVEFDIEGFPFVITVTPI